MQGHRFFYGWWVAGALSVMVFISTGIRFTVGPFLKPVVADLGIDRAQFSLVVSVSLFLYGAFMPFVGRLVDRFGARPVSFAGTLVLAGSLVATGRVTTLGQFAVIYGVVVALGLSATGHVVAAAILSRWFNRRRGTALSAISGASMAGMSLLVPLAMWLILAVGWRSTYLILGIATLVVMVPLTLWVVRDAPEALGLHPDGAVAPPAGASIGDAERTALATAVQAPSFWQLSGGLFTCGFSMSLLSAHGVPMLTDHGYHPMVASWALGLLGGSSVGFSMILGAVSDRFGRRPVLTWIYAARALTFSGLFLIREQPAALMGVAILGGASMAGSLAMTSALTADIFGRFSVGSIFGMIFLVHQAGAALGSWLGGTLFEMTGGYGTAFAVAAVMLLGAALLSLTIDERARCLPSLVTRPAGGK